MWGMGPAKHKNDRFIRIGLPTCDVTHCLCDIKQPCIDVTDVVINHSTVQIVEQNMLCLHDELS